MNVTLGPTIARVSGRIPTQAVEAMTLTLRYRPKGYQHTTLFKLHKWDGWKSLLRQDEADYVFPTGLWPRVRQGLAQAAVPVTVDDTRETIQGTPVIQTPSGLTLYDDQQDVLQAALDSDGRGLLNLATNFGKTELMACLSLSYGGPTLVMVAWRKLLTETAGRLRDLLQEPVGELGAGRKPRGSERVIVAMPQTARPGAWLDPIRVLLVDEAHNVSPVSWFPLLGRCPAPVRFGLSGTIREVQPLIIEAFLGPLLIEVEEKALVDLGRSATPRIWMPNVQVPSSVPSMSDYSTLYAQGIVGNVSRNRMIVEACQWTASQRLRTLVLVWAIQHGRTLSAMLTDKGLTTDFVSGQTVDPTYLDRAVERLVSGETQVLVASGIFNQGVNIPELEVLINAAGWRSPLATRQKLGRALRRKPHGANEVLVIDPYDWGNRLLEKHSDDRLRTYQRQGFQVSTGALQALLRTT